jgi:hypothetical protein
MDRRPQGSARTDEKECAHFALLVAVFIDGGYPGNRVLAEYWTSDILLFVVRYQLRLVVRAYCSIQVPTLADLEQKELTENCRWCILRQLVRFR